MCHPHFPTVDGTQLGTAGGGSRWFFSLVSDLKLPTGAGFCTISCTGRCPVEMQGRSAPSATDGKSIGPPVWPATRFGGPQAVQQHLLKSDHAVALDCSSRQNRVNARVFTVSIIQPGHICEGFTKTLCKKYCRVLSGAYTIH